MATENLFAIRTFIFAYPMLDKEQMTCYNGADMTGNGEWSMKRYRVAALLTAVLCAILLFGCAGGKIADDRETQKTSYQQVSQDEAMTMMANERDYTSLTCAHRRNMQKNIFPVQSVFPMKQSEMRRCQSCRTGTN